MKITVIATGFDSARQTLREFVAPPQFNNNIQNQQETQPSNPQPEQTPSPIGQQPASPKDENEEEVWDIPAFLRQKN